MTGRHLTGKRYARARAGCGQRTVRKWKSGQTRMEFTTWCYLCWLARA
nr:hypothetical protein [Citrobacter amalonaticus]